MLAGLTGSAPAGWLNSGSEPVLEHHVRSGTPNGAFAEIDMVGDRQRKRWVSIQTCSLRDPHDDISCARTCLWMLNDSHAAPARAATASPTEIR
jgi:hypothetical protein